MVPRLHQTNVHIKKELQVWRVQKCISLVSAKTELPCAGWPTTPSHVSQHRAENGNLRKFGSTFRASLITGMEYGMERWNGKWNGTVNVHSCSQLVLQMLSFKVELATVCLGLLSHRRGCMRKSSACCQHSSLSGITMSELAGPRRPARTMHRSHAYYC